MAVRIQDGSGNALTSSGNALDVNLKTTSLGGLALDGTDQTGVAPPTGAVGIRGWLSAIYNILKNGSIAVTGTFFQGTQPVSGTFFQATQPVSGTVTANAGTNMSTAALALETGGNLAAVAGQLPAATAKGTQAATFGAMQQPKDTGRTKVVLTITKAAGITAEALVSMTIKKGTAVTSAATTYAVTALKTFRIQSIFLGVTNITTATLLNVAVRLREGAAGGGAATVTSDIIAELEAGNQAATLQTSGQAEIVFPDGLEITASQSLGLSELATSANCQVTVVITGYEY